MEWKDGGRSVHLALADSVGLWEGLGGGDIQAGVTRPQSLWGQHLEWCREGHSGRQEVGGDD